MAHLATVRPTLLRAVTSGRSIPTEPLRPGRTEKSRYDRAVCNSMDAGSRCRDLRHLRSSGTDWRCREQACADGGTACRGVGSARHGQFAPFAGRSQGRSPSCGTACDDTAAVARACDCKQRECSSSNKDPCAARSFAVATSQHNRPTKCKGTHSV